MHKFAKFWGRLAKDYTLSANLTDIHIICLGVWDHHHCNVRYNWLALLVLQRVKESNRLPRVSSVRRMSRSEIMLTAR